MTTYLPKKFQEILAPSAKIPARLDFEDCTEVDSTLAQYNSRVKPPATFVPLPLPTKEPSGVTKVALPFFRAALLPNRPNRAELSARLIKCRRRRTPASYQLAGSR